MTPESSGTFVNYLGGDFKEGRHKSSVNAHIARRKHAHKRHSKNLLRSQSDNDASTYSQNEVSLPIMSRSQSIPYDAEAEELVRTTSDFYIHEDSSSPTVHMGPPTSLSPYYDFFHLLLPPAFFGINIPLNALVPEPALSSETQIRKFAYLNSIFYHEVLSYIFDADTIFLRHTNQYIMCIENTQRFSYAVCAMIQLMQHWTIDESSPTPSYVLENAARAMSRIRVSLSDQKKPHNDTVLLELTGLASLTHLLQDNKAFGLHCKMLLDIVKQRGGFQALNNIHLAQMICKTCKVVTTDTALQPVYNHDLVSSGYIEQVSFLSQMNELINDLPVGFQNLSRQTPISIRALRVLDRAARLAAAKDPDAHLVEYSKFPKTYSSFVNGAPDTIRPDNGNPSCEKLLDLAITLYARVGWGRRPASNRLFLSGRVDLIPAIKLFDARSEAHKEFLIWVWAVTIDAWYTNTNVLTSTGQALLADLKSRYPETADFTYVQTIVDKFLWTPELSRFCRVYW